MTTTQAIDQRASRSSTDATVDLKLEVVVIPVSDIDRSKRFYQGLGWQVDADFSNDKGWRGVQMTPPGSPCSIQFGKDVTTATPGSAQGLYLVVSDIAAARASLISQGAEVSEVFHHDADRSRLPGPDPQRRTYSSWASFSDPDGNGWLVQEVTTRLPGRGLGGDVNTLTTLLREAEEHHGQFEPTAPKHHWSDWYARFIVVRQRGGTVDAAASEASAAILARH